MEQLSDQARAWLDAAVDFVLETGLQQMTLRPLGQHLGTSDRMVLYHFGSKEQLVARVITRASERLAASVLHMLTPKPRNSTDALLRFWSVLSDAEALPYVRLYLELLVAAMRDPAPYAESVEQIMGAWLALAERLLATTGEALPRNASMDALVVLEGLIVVRTALGAQVDAEATLRRLAKGWKVAAKAAPAARARRPARK